LDGNPSVAIKVFIGRSASFWGLYFSMIKSTVLRLMLGIGLPIASAMVMDQLPKSGVAQVPFAFQIGGQTLPAGTYSVSQADLGRGIRIQTAQLNGLDLKYRASQHKFGRVEPARLIFDTSDGQYRLSEVWLEADGRGMVLPDSSPAKRETKCVWLR
jgi:hypothetical protein